MQRYTLGPHLFMNNPIIDLENCSKRRQARCGQGLYARLIVFVWLSAIAVANGQPLDTLLQVGKYTLHVNVIPGKGTPILLEAGGGDNGNVWKSLTDPWRPLQRPR